jgi:hypothetical protein
MTLECRWAGCSTTKGSEESAGVINCLRFLSRLNISHRRDFLEEKLAVHQPSSVSDSLVGSAHTREFQQAEKMTIT